MEAEEFLRNVDLFEELDTACLSYLAAKLQLVSLPEGPLVRKGDPGDAMYIVKSGVATVTTSSESGRMGVALALLKQGDSFGEVALIDGMPRTADVNISQQMECYKLAREDFQTALIEHPEIARALLPRLAVYIRRADAWVTDFLDKMGGKR